MAKAFKVSIDQCQKFSGSNNFGISKVEYVAPCPTCGKSATGYRLTDPAHQLPNHTAPMQATLICEHCNAAHE